MEHENENRKLPMMNVHKGVSCLYYKSFICKTCVIPTVKHTTRSAASVYSSSILEITNSQSPPFINL